MTAREVLTSAPSVVTVTSSERTERAMELGERILTFREDNLQNKML